jgi:hypothetical protein
MDVWPDVAIIAQRPGTTAISSQGCSAVENFDTNHMRIAAGS